MKQSIYSIITAVIVTMLSLTSCRKDLCYNHYAAADVSFSWENEWERNYGMSYASNWISEYYGFDYNKLRPSTPEWITLVKFSSDGVPREKYLSPDGGEVVLDKSQNQSFLFYNSDTEYIVLSDLEKPYASATTTSRTRASISYIKERHPDVRSMNPPDVLYASFVEKVPNVGIHELYPMPVKMQPLVYTYLVRYEFEHGKEQIAYARGAIGGLAESVYLRDGKTSEETAIILYDCAVTPYGCEALVRSFGVPGFPDEYYGRSADNLTKERLYTLNLEIMLEDGKIFEFNFDIADQMVKQPRGGVIKVTGLRIEDGKNISNSAFEVNITDWGSRVDVDLPVSSK